ncbi:MAG: mannitol dehydrogenase family protein [Novosphingobium sp.]
MEIFAYDRQDRGIGIVHFGMGAFHRAHLAAYTDDALSAAGGNWKVLGVSLRSAGVREQLRPQDGLYSLLVRSAAGSRARIVGSVADVLVAPEERDRLIEALAAPATHIASFTITEKGYCRAPDGSLDIQLADDRSAYPYLAAAFARRREAGLPGLTLLSCDNLAGNGAQLQRLVGKYLDARAPRLRDWFENECTCPSTMVDRIAPATTDADRAEAAELLGGLRDEAAVVTEPFSQWVIEDNFAGPRPSWEAQGAQLTSDVHVYETAKLRMLNGAHSALAYLGLQHGHEFVHQAMADTGLAPLIGRLMRQEAAPSIEAAPGQDLSAYAEALLARFANPALEHRLIQIAMDGSQKVPQRWLETLAFHQGQGRQCPAILAGIAAWLRHVRGDNIATCGPVDDPLAERLAATWEAAGKYDIVEALFGSAGPMASQWRPDAADRAHIAERLG